MFHSPLKVQKLPRVSLIKRPPVKKMAPPGHHVVSRQARISKTGIKYYVKVHVRKNRGKKIVLLPENIPPGFWKLDPELVELRNKEKELSQDLRRKDRAFAEMSARIVLLKKSRLIWGDGEDDE